MPTPGSRVLVGLLADPPRKNCWTIAEHAGDAAPDGMQHLLARAVWDTDGVREDLRDYVVDHLGEPGAVLVLDKTGDLKKGIHTVGVQRQHTGTAGRMENAQVAVYPSDAARGGHALIDRALYLPRSWTQDRDWCAVAGVPDDIVFATKPALAPPATGCSACPLVQGRGCGDRAQLQADEVVELVTSVGGGGEPEPAAGGDLGDGGREGRGGDVVALVDDDQAV